MFAVIAAVEPWVHVAFCCVVTSQLRSQDLLAGPGNEVAISFFTLTDEVCPVYFTAFSAACAAYSLSRRDLIIYSLFLLWCWTNLACSVRLHQRHAWRGRLSLFEVTWPRRASSDDYIWMERGRLGTMPGHVRCRWEPPPDLNWSGQRTSPLLCSFAVSFNWF